MLQSKTKGNVCTCNLQKKKFLTIPIGVSLADELIWQEDAQCFLKTSLKYNFRRGTDREG